MKQEYEEKTEQIKKEKKRAVKYIKDKFEGEINFVKNEMKTMLKELQAQNNENIIRKNFARLSGINSDFSE